MISLNSCWIIQLFLLFHTWAAIATTPTLDTQEQIVHLQPSITLYNNTAESLRTIRVICPTGTQWTVPDTIESSAQILLEYHASEGSLLTIHLPVNKTASRTAFRGLYECCPMQLEVPRSLSWMKRPSQPICCPCCPWYEQHLCLTRDLTSTPFERQSKSSCSGLFLFTGTVNTEPVRLYIVPDEPMLLPCPAPFHWVNSGNKTKLPLTVRHQFFLHTTLGTPWFPFSGNDLGINHTYDPRYGLCLHRAQFPRTTLQLACHYESASQVRLVQTFWPPSSPTIPPVVQLRFASSWLPRTIEPNWNEYQHVNEGVQTEAIYRARVGDSVRLQCIGIYTQSRIVKQPPPKLCFLWSWFEANETDSIKPYNVTSNATHDWHLNACPDIQSTSKPRSAVYATNDMELPPINRPITVACQVRTPTRVAPAVSRQVRVVPVLTNSNRISWMIGSHNQQSVMLIPLNRTLEQTRSNHTALLMISAQDDNKTEFKVFVRLYFWAEHETSDWPACVFDNQTIPTGSIRSVRRVRDMWQCDITWYQTTQATNVPIILRYANLTQSIMIFTTTTLNGTTPQLTGLHGNVRKTMQLTCLRTKQEQALSRLFDSHFVKKSYSTRFIWNIELQDGPQGLTHAFNLSQNQPTLVLQPLHEENSTLVWSYSIASNQTISDFPDTGLPVPVRGPRFICAQCCSVYMEHVMWAGPPKCQKLTEWPLDSWPQYNTSSPQAKLALFLRQKEMPTQSWYNATQNPVVFYVLENVPYRLECMLLGGLSLNRTRNMSPQLWPRFQWWNGTNITQALVNQQTWQLSPYSRTLSLSLIPLEGAKTTNLLQCHFANLTIQARIQSTKPTEPVIMDVGAIDAHRKTKNEQSRSLFHLYCQVVGFPLSDIYWELGFLDSAQKNSLEWIKFHTCNAPHELNSSFTSHACNITVRSSELLRAEQIRCRATSYRKTVIKSLQLNQLYLLPVMGANAQNGTENSLGLIETRWLVGMCSLILPILGILIMSSLCLYHRTRKRSSDSGFHPIANALYVKPSRSVYYRRQDEWESSICCKLDMESEAIRELVYLLGSVDQLFRWHIPADYVELTGTRLGLGHYGRVIKGWYVESHVAAHTAVRIPVAIKTASEEMSSSQCLRNEIQILSGLTDGPNVARMLGLIVGSRRDLSDTYLVLEYCEHRSLAEFVRKHASHLIGTDTRAQKTSIHSYDSGVYSMNGTDLGTERTSPKDVPPVDVITSIPTKLATAELNLTYRLTQQTLYELAWGIANGVDFLARSGIIHRDLATRNVLVDVHYTPRICDFGLAVRVVRTDAETIRDDSYRITSFQKQLPFRILPLEALREQTFYLASDVWEMGLLFWQLFHLESKKPFMHARSAEDLVLQLELHFRINQNPTQAPVALVRPRLVQDDDLWHMMCRAWQADPKQRPAAKQFCILLNDILSRMRHEKPGASTEPVHELNYITCMDRTSTEQQQQQPETLM